MSKRFGRNQKRKLSQQLAAQRLETERFTKAHQMADGLLSHVSRELAHAKHQLGLLYHEIGKNLNPGHPLVPEDLRRWFVVSAVDMSRVPLSTDRTTTRVVDILRKGLVTDEFKNLVSVRLTHGDKTVGYAVDIKSLLVASFRDEYIDDLSRDIARHLVDTLATYGGTA